MVERLTTWHFSKSCKNIGRESLGGAKFLLEQYHNKCDLGKNEDKNNQTNKM